MKLVFNFYIIVIMGLILGSCTNEDEKKDIIEGHLNVVLLIGDGMGLSQLSSAFYYGDTAPNLAEFIEIGLINTSSSKQKITDSGAGATAFACGEKTYNGSIGFSSDSVSIPNLVEILSEKGYNTGVISTSSVTHATPAAFFAHVKDRGLQEEIALQLVDSEIDFFAGGGTSYFTNRKDSLNLIDSLTKNGFEVNLDILKLVPDENSRYGFLLADNGMPKMMDNRGDFLPNYTQLALDYFTKLGNGFFLMVEGSQIDWAGHSNDSDYLISEMMDFDKTVGVALDYAKLKGNTIVIVLADHETGGFALSPDSGDYSTIKPAFATTGHSTTLIPVLAYGPGAENFKGIYQNNEIFHKIIEVTDK